MLREERHGGQSRGRSTSLVSLGNSRASGMVTAAIAACISTTSPEPEGVLDHASDGHADGAGNETQAQDRPGCQPRPTGNADGWRKGSRGRQQRTGGSGRVAATEGKVVGTSYDIYHLSWNTRINQPVYGSRASGWGRPTQAVEPRDRGRLRRVGRRRVPRFLRGMLPHRARAAGVLRGGIQLRR